jgi:hypothetical protein
MSDVRPPEPSRRRLPVSGIDGRPHADGGAPTDRSRLLRRSGRTTFQLNGSHGPRLRRQRRVCASFSGIPDLARNGTP